MNFSDQTHPKRARLQFVVLALIFAAPITGALLLFFVWPHWTPQARLNYGTLVHPARPAPEFALIDIHGEAASALAPHRWGLVYLAGPECDEECRQRLYLTRQVRTALNKDRPRVLRVYVAPDEAALAAARALLAEDHPELRFIADQGQAGHRVADFLQPQDPHALYLLDPHGNWLMVYTGAIEPKGLHRDLKKLLRFSQIG
jgi:hypothetical protein